MKIKVNNSFYIEFNDFTFTTKLDSVASTFGFSSRFDPDNDLHKDFFKPLSFHSVEFFDDNDKLFFTGTIVGHRFDSSSATKLVPISGYSKAGILEDCTIPYSEYPLENNLSNLSDISLKILKPFDISFTVESSVQNEVKMSYKKSTAEPTESVKDYLSKLAYEKNIIISHDEKGDLVYFRPDPKGPVSGLYDSSNVSSMSIDYVGQSMHSDLTVLSQPSQEGSSFSPFASIKNPLISKYRTTVKTLSSGEDTDVDRDVKNLMGEQLKSISLKLSFNRWDDLKNGDIIEVQNKKLYLYNKAKFMVSEITRSQNSNGRLMSVTAVLPESFSGDQPKNIFE